MNKTSIEYLTHTWNPIAMRCTPVSEGCAHCWHLRMADRLTGNSVFPDDVRAAYAGEGPPVLVEKRLREPLLRRKPAIIGTQFMGDLFHEDLQDADIEQVFEIIYQAQWHDFPVLTKRLNRARRFINEAWFNCKWRYRMNPHHPIPNLWLGVTVENQKTADERIPVLLQTPAAVRFVSIEPMLESIDIKDALHGYPEQISIIGYVSHDMALDAQCPEMEGMAYSEVEWKQTMPALDWVICGGESGPKARPMHPDWARSLRDQCQTAKVPFFFKQHGAWLHESQYQTVDIHTPGAVVMPEKKHDHHRWPDGSLSHCVGKKAAGCLLDGRVWDEMPQTLKERHGS